MKIYVASSWRNQIYPEVVRALREDGHDVYDFRNPPGGTGFSWQQVDATDAKTIEAYFKALDTDIARAGFASDRKHLEECDACVLVLPSGRSAHIEAGYAAGQGKRVIVLLHEDKFEPELMYLLCDGITDSLAMVRELVDLKGPAERR